MKVTLKLLATYRELFPAELTGSQTIVEVADDATVDVVLQKFNIPTGSASVILIDGHAAKPGQKLKDGDVVCAFPAMAGG